MKSAAPPLVPTRRVHRLDRCIHLGEMLFGMTLRRERRSLAVEDAP